MSELNSELNLVIGLGKTGLSCLKYGVKKGWNMAVTDSRTHPPEEAAAAALNIPMVLGGFSKELISKATRLIISPGVSLQEKLIQEAILRGVSCVGDIELFAQEIKNTPVVAITGSNAKSTVVTLVYEMAKAQGLKAVLAGNIGTPVLDSIEDNAEIYILELSSFQLETTHSLKPKVAVILNLSEDHMDRYDSLENYKKAKMRIYQNAESVVVNRKDPSLFPVYLLKTPWGPVAAALRRAREINFAARGRDLAAAPPQGEIEIVLTPRKIQCPNSATAAFASFGLEAPKQGEYGVINNYLAYGDQKLLAIDKLNCKGMHFVENSLAALAIGNLLGLSQDSMLGVLKNFKGLPHRCQLIREMAGVSFYDDSKGTNVGATIAALEGLGKIIRGKIILIAGGVGKNADFSMLKSTAEHYIKTALLIGEAAEELAHVLPKSQRMKSLESAVLHAAEIAKPGDAVLLSPACASFDMFKDYKHRGEVFAKCVLALKG